MQTKEFIKKQIKSFASAITPEQFLELTDHEYSLIVLDVPIADYTLTEIARLVEDNNARIIRLEVLPAKDELGLFVSLKLNVGNISAVLRSFERFNYNVVYYFMKEEELNDTYEDRLKELLHYLEM
ncbi:MAG: hypothetical protein ACOH2V_02030 [Candidatus Saccharimonadaceae bacterium]